ncbi:MAG: hypothetical protein HON70_01020 [Lentisphaerae bacterium]|nr:hypothetical protein [Lentisphaerota bacterium]
MNTATSGSLLKLVQCLSGLAVFGLSGAPALTAPVSLQNGSFEDLVVLKAAPVGNAVGKWDLKTDLQAPAHWGLSSAYPGELTVV